VQRFSTFPSHASDSHNNSSTGANGQIVTTTIQSTILITPSVGPSSGGSKSNTGAIVGGIAGGIAGLVAILLIGLFCWRRNRTRRDDFDGNFDPDRVVRHGGATDLAGAEVTPYQYEPGALGVGAAGAASVAPLAELRWPAKLERKWQHAPIPRWPSALSGQRRRSHRHFRLALRAYVQR
jgi:hypothetical protein